MPRGYARAREYCFRQVQSGFGAFPRIDRAGAVARSLWQNRRRKTKRVEWNDSAVVNLSPGVAAMRVIYASTEIYPALKTGGLADVNAALPRALIEAGADVRLLLPAFPAIVRAATDVQSVTRLKAPFGGADVRILRGILAGVPAYLIEAGGFYARDGNPYVDASGRDWPDNYLRFALLGWVAARFADGTIDDWRPDIVHGHDWHAGLAPAYITARGGERPACVFTVHNLGYQGEFAAETFRELALPPSFFSIYGVEFYGKVNFMKAGLHYADRITTVSPTYAQEIQTSEFGFGMDGLLRSRAGVLSGVLNGVDRAVWSPANDAAIAVRYDEKSPQGKTRCKAALRTEMGLTAGDGPLFGVVSRLTPQKGLDLVLEALPELVACGGQLALLGTGDAELEVAFRAAAAKYPGAISVCLSYDEGLAHRIIAGSDVVLVPSRFEPCGLTQLYALAYGALPLVRRVGGLADTVCDSDAKNIAAGVATGFVFTDASANGLREALKRVISLWRAPRQWASVRRTAMRQDFSWTPAARRYIELYRELRPLA
jgi:starch synthase